MLTPQNKTVLEAQMLLFMVLRFPKSILAELSFFYQQFLCLLRYSPQGTLLPSAVLLAGSMVSCSFRVLVGSLSRPWVLEMAPDPSATQE